MKAKVFISQVSPKKDTKKRTDYWGLLFVGLIFTASISSFLFSAHQEGHTISVNSLQSSIAADLVVMNSQIPVLVLPIT